MVEKEPQTHVWRKPCGCVASLILNDPYRFGELAKAQRYAEKHNETYELMETEAVRKMAWRCDEHKKEKNK